MGSIPLVESLMDYRNIHTIFFYFVVFCLTWRSFYDNGSKYSNSVTLIGLMLIVVPFLPASNLLIRVGFVVAERILYISRFACLCFIFDDLYHITHSVCSTNQNMNQKYQMLANFYTLFEDMDRLNLQYIIL